MNLSHQSEKGRKCLYIFESSVTCLVWHGCLDWFVQCCLFSTARRLEKEVKQVLDEISYDQGAKERLIRGRQVDLAEELSK